MNILVIKKPCTIKPVYISSGRPNYSVLLLCTIQATFAKRYILTYNFKVGVGLNVCMIDLTK